jgi:hypothetical protein
MMCPGNPDDEVARVKVLCGKNGGTMVDNDFTNIDGPVDFFDSHDNNVSDTAINADADDGSYSKGAPATKKKRKKGAMTKTGGKQANKCNKKCRHNNTTINPDLVLLSGKGDADGEEGDADGYSGGDDKDNLDNNFFKEKRYEKMKAKYWMKHTGRRPGREIHLIPFGGTTELFCPKVSNKELKGFIDAHSDIRFSRIFE